MSSYLVSWAVLPEDYQSRSLPDDPDRPTKVSVWGRKSEIENGYADLALQLAPAFIQAMVTYTGIKDALPPKIDLIALPYYPQITTPSWGLNAFREDFLLYNPKYDSDLVESGIALTLAKDIAANVNSF
jgi:aminopeptidase N